MKAQSKAKRVKSKVKGGPHKNPQNVRPNVSSTRVEIHSPDYSSMWQAIQRVADPVGFESLKKFYNL